MKFQSLPTPRELASTQNLGIDNIKIVLTILLTFLSDILNVFKTGNWLQLGQTLIGLLQYGNIVMIAQQALEEFKDLDQQESAELSRHFAQEFDLQDDEVEAKIEQAVAVIPEAYELVLDGLDIFARGNELVTRVRSLFGKAGKLEAIAA
jgi:superfamily I DNA and RNA helicase